jgi:hypothetical protein
MKSHPHKFGPHFTIRPLPGGGVELGYTHHTINLGPLSGSSSASIAKRCDSSARRARPQRSSIATPAASGCDSSGLSARDPKGAIFTEAWPIFRRHGFAFRTEDYREVLARLRTGDLAITPSKNYRPSIKSATRSLLSPLTPLAPLNISLELFLPNGSSFVAMETAKATYLEIGLRGHLPLLFDITEPGCPYEKALWALEKKWPERCRG